MEKKNEKRVQVSLKTIFDEDNLWTEKGKEKVG